jgi:CO dehydrogenase/acetyl-CoA synthase gamma subunit (corrinoid Fe-S protein)
MPVPPARPSSAKKRAARPTEVPYAAWAVGIAVLAATTMAICAQPMAAQVMKAAIEAVVSNRPLTYKRGPATPLHFAESLKWIPHNSKNE